MEAAAHSYSELNDIATRVARRVARDQSHVDLEDLRQTAWLALISFAVPNYDPAKGPFKPWAWQAAIRPCLWAASRAGRDHSSWEEIERRVDWPNQETEEAEVEFERAIWRDKVAGALRGAVAGTTREDLQVVMREKTIGQRAAELGTTDKNVSARCAEIRRRVKESTELRKLWRGRP